MCGRPRWADIVPHAFGVHTADVNTLHCEHMSAQEWQEHPDVLYATPLAMPGQKVVGPQDGMPTWVCEFMVVKPTVEEAIEFVTAVEKSLQVPIA